MVRDFSRRLFLGATAGVLAQAAVAAPPAASLRPVVRGAEHFKKSVEGGPEIVAAAKLGGRVCYAVADARSGVRLEGSNSGTGIPPASVAKAITALYALDILGPSHRFVTRLVAIGAVTGGVLSGDLILLGGGDPTLDTNVLAALPSVDWP
jgi:D-alanyl-D-alanine carboxypeptidase/D-alanyl-D-alanine-endopeptidase (penicillin-binding protein 4)